MSYVMTDEGADDPVRRQPMRLRHDAPPECLREGSRSESREMNVGGVAQRERQRERSRARRSATLGFSVVGFFVVPTTSRAVRAAPRDRRVAYRWKNG